MINKIFNFHSHFLMTSWRWPLVLNLEKLCRKEKDFKRNVVKYYNKFILILEILLLNKFKLKACSHVFVLYSHCHTEWIVKYTSAFKFCGSGKFFAYLTFNMKWVIAVNWAKHFNSSDWKLYCSELLHLCEKNSFHKSYTLWKQNYFFYFMIWQKIMINN